jgi:hypothetical protein
MAPRPMRRVRFEAFGAIVQLALPRALVFVDRATARRVVRGTSEPTAWRGRETELGDGVLSAPRARRGSWLHRRRLLDRREARRADHRVQLRVATAGADSARKVVSAHVRGDASAPDPECPRVRAIERFRQ